MRHLVTFILRLWVETETDSPNWEGQVECVATGERLHVRNRDDIAHFVEARIHPKTASRDEPRMSNEEFDVRHL